jgi:RimJ/RimL family protein N-acetyltransferase
VFETTRLSAAEWHSVALAEGHDLGDVVMAMLTDATTVSLPPQWQGTYSRERADGWIAERDDESVTLLAIERQSREPLGLVILFELAHTENPTALEVRLGYLFAESAWGLGYASELVQGLVRWCQEQPTIRSISGGVALDNAASVRVLTKNGFVADGDPEGDDQLYTLTLSR